MLRWLLRKFSEIAWLYVRCDSMKQEPLSLPPSACPSIYSPELQQPACMHVKHMAPYYSRAEHPITHYQTPSSAVKRAIVQSPSCPPIRSFPS